MDGTQGHGDRLTLEQVHRLARLARLELAPDRLDAYRDQLARILDHMRVLEGIDVEGIEPMIHPGDARDRLDDDVPGPMMPREVLMRLAPQAEEPFIAVPRVLDGSTGE